MPITNFISPCVSILVGIVLIVCLQPIYRATRHAGLALLLYVAGLEIFGAVANLVYNYAVQGGIAGRAFALRDAGWIGYCRFALTSIRCATVSLYAVGTIRLARTLRDLTRGRRF